MSFASLPRGLLLLSLGVAIGSSVTYLLTRQSSRDIAFEDGEPAMAEDIVDGVEGLIGATKLVRIRSLSMATGCDILAKAEVLVIGYLCLIVVS
jgi:cysteine synthase